MASPENFLIRAAGVSSIALAVFGCGDAAPVAVSDSDSARVISHTPEPTATRTVLLQENEDFRLGFGQWRFLFNKKLFLRSWSGDGLDFKAQGLEHYFKQCGIGSLPGSAQITFVLSNHWPLAVEVTPGIIDISLSIARGSLKDEVDTNADFIAGLCVGTEVSRQYREGGHTLTPGQIRDRVTERAKDFRQAIQTGQVPRAITIRSGN